MRARMYARLGYVKAVNDATAIIQSVGGRLTIDLPADEVEAMIGDTVAFRALHKGGGIWVILYNEDLWGKPS